MVFLVNRELLASPVPPVTSLTEKRENPVYLDKMVFQEQLEPRFVLSKLISTLDFYQSSLYANFLFRGLYNLM